MGLMYRKSMTILSIVFRVICSVNDVQKYLLDAILSSRLMEITSDVCNKSMEYPHNVCCDKKIDHEICS